MWNNFSSFFELTKADKEWLVKVQLKNRIRPGNILHTTLHDNKYISSSCIHNTEYVQIYVPENHT